MTRVYSSIREEYFSLVKGIIEVHNVLSAIDEDNELLGLIRIRANGIFERKKKIQRELSAQEKCGD